MSVQITAAMYEAAVREAEKRENQGCIEHHFDLGHFDDATRNVLGFLGEFAGKEELGIDWAADIRKDYLTIDAGDVVKNHQIVDIKTETVPRSFFWKIIRKEINDDGAFGRRLICQGQVGLLHKYNYVVWGAFIREDCERWVQEGCPPESAPQWYSLGYLDAKYILNNYTVQAIAPHGKPYREPALAVRTSELKSLFSLKRLLK